MVVAEMNIDGAKVGFVDDYVVSHNVTREQSIETLNRVADRMLLQLNMQRWAKNAKENGGIKDEIKVEIQAKAAD